MEPIGYQIKMLSKLFGETIKMKVEKSGISVTQFHIIKFLDINSDCEVTQKDICEYLKMKAPTISITLTNMENDNLIYRRKSEKDSRKTFIALSSEGCKLAASCKKIFKELDQIMESSLSSEELNLLNQSLNKMKNKLLEVQNNG